MSNFSLTVFGPEDGYQEFTFPQSGPVPKELYKITPQDFEFNQGGKLIQIINTDSTGFYIAYHEQVLSSNGLRNGYTFGEGLLCTDKIFDSSKTLKILFDFHNFFAKECINEEKRFDGFHFINSFIKTLPLKVAKLNELSIKSFDNNQTQITKDLYKNNAYIICESIGLNIEVSSILNWMLDSIGSTGVSRLFIIDKFSGTPSEKFRLIDRIDVETNFIVSELNNEKLKLIHKLDDQNKVLKNENTNLQIQYQNALQKINSINSNTQSIKTSNSVPIASTDNKISVHLSKKFSDLESQFDELLVISKELKKNNLQLIEEIKSLSPSQESENYFGYMFLFCFVVLGLISSAVSLWFVLDLRKQFIHTNNESNQFSIYEKAILNKMEIFLDKKNNQGDSEIPTASSSERKVPPKSK